MVLSSVRKLLQRDLIQRSVYVCVFVLWTFSMWNRVTGYGYSESSLGVNYSTLYTIPAMLLIVQIILNNRLFWALIVGLVTTGIGVVLWLVIADGIERSGNHVKAIPWEARDVIGLAFSCALIVVVEWVLVAIRPQKD
jgi:hypothetical protein